MKLHLYCGFIAFFKKILYNKGKNIKKITRAGRGQFIGIRLSY